jgi:hypothetical protein
MATPRKPSGTPFSVEDRRTGCAKNQSQSMIKDAILLVTRCRFLAVTARLHGLVRKTHANFGAVAQGVDTSNGARGWTGSGLQQRDISGRIGRATPV